MRAWVHPTSPPGTNSLRNFRREPRWVALKTPPGMAAAAGSASSSFLPIGKGPSTSHAAMWPSAGRPCMVAARWKALAAAAVLRAGEEG